MATNLTTTTRTLTKLSSMLARYDNYSNATKYGFKLFEGELASSLQIKLCHFETLQQQIKGTSYTFTLHKIVCCQTQFTTELTFRFTFHSMINLQQSSSGREGINNGASQRFICRSKTNDRTDYKKKVSVAIN